jgi:hypothetical protein
MISENCCGQRLEIGIGTPVGIERFIGGGIVLASVAQRVQELELFRPLARTLARHSKMQYSTFLLQSLPEDLGAGEGNGAFAPPPHHQHCSVL